MQWDDLRYFLTLAREGSLSATARALAIEHTTVARRISRLEQALGLKLFDRLARGWTTTPEGQALFEKACQLEEDMQALQRAAKGHSALAGRMRVTAPPLLLSHFVLAHLDEFRSAYPNIELELIGERRGANLGRGEADIALRMNEPGEPELVARTLGQVAYGLYGSPEWCARPEAEHAFIGFDDSLPALTLKRWLDGFVQGRRYALRSNDMMAMCQAAAQGWGIALMPCFLARTDGRLQALPAGVPTPSLPLYLVMHADVRRAPRVRCTADALVALFGRHGHELGPAPQ